MNSIVYLEPNRMDAEPFTTSAIIAEWTGITHRKLKVAIRKNLAELEEFGLVALYGAESTGGRPEEHYRLNEQQATLLITFLKNTPNVIKFKVAMVKAFYAMRQELNRREAKRIVLLPVRRTMTDAIAATNPSHWDYKHYTDLAYKKALGMTAAQLRKERNATAKDVAADYMTATEIDAVTKATYQIAALIELGYQYGMVKRILTSGLTHSQHVTA